ncbi:hypothetical protein QR680_015242 [Steinernema hermaphroditum]|uniref:Uncharacterized protein n=1 Tax=Steinernema hermaphroditum TaxID=289476 RepID=A0AA39H819_9BILA|nr:hypothetical protein QR680_015242 [Steinernema hermaphroditum]
MPNLLVPPGRTVAHRENALRTCVPRRVYQSIAVNTNTQRVNKEIGVAQRPKEQTSFTSKFSAPECYTPPHGGMVTFRAEEERPRRTLYVTPFGGTFVVHYSK